MIDALFNQPSYVTAKSMLDVSELRQQAIAANIANVETPGYKRLEVARSFESEFRRAVGEANLDALQSLHPSLEVDRTAVASTRDGNTVKLEDELLDLNTNFVEHALHTRLVNGSLLKLRLAITGKV